jgi:hypothetical protein
VQVDRFAGVSGTQAPVLRFADREVVACGLQVGQVCGLVIGVVDAGEDVHHRLRGETGDGGRTDVFDWADPLAEDAPQFSGTGSEASRPAAVVVCENDLRRLQPVHEDCGERGAGERTVPGAAGGAWFI